MFMASKLKSSAAGHLVANVFGICARSILNVSARLRNLGHLGRRELRYFGLQVLQGLQGFQRIRVLPRVQGRYGFQVLQGIRGTQGPNAATIADPIECFGQFELWHLRSFAPAQVHEFGRLPVVSPRVAGHFRTRFRS